jgi:hypothetical protein
MHSKQILEHPPPPLTQVNPLNAELNPTYHLLALLGAHPILHISRIRVNGIVYLKQDMHILLFFTIFVRKLLTLINI